MDSDYQAGHGLPTDFPSDPTYGGVYLIGGLSTLLLLAILAGALLGFITGMRDKYRANYTDWPRQIALFIKRKCNEVIRTRGEGGEEAGPAGFFPGLFGGPVRRSEEARKNVRDIDYARAGLVAGYVRALLGNSLRLGKEMSGELKGLSEALEGFKEIKDPNAAVVPGLAGPMTGGAIINIAVNQGPNGQGANDPVQVIGGPYAAGVPYGGIVMPGAAVSPQLQAPLVIDRDANIWLAYNKFRDEWNNPDVMAGQLASAQAQLCVRPVEPPKPFP